MDITITLTDPEWEAVQAAAEEWNAGNRRRPDPPKDTPADVFFVQQVSDRILAFWMANAARAQRNDLAAQVLALPPEALVEVQAILAANVSPVVVAEPPTLGAPNGNVL